MDKAIAAAETAVTPALAEPGEQVQSPHDHVVQNNTVPSGTDAVLLSVVMGVGAIAGLVANPVVGALPDRTTSPRGRRCPWTLGWALAADSNVPLVVAPLAAGVVLGLMNSYPALFALSGFVTIIATWTVTCVRSVRRAPLPKRYLTAYLAGEDEMWRSPL